MLCIPVRGGAVWQLVGLITRRSEVRILPPLPNPAGARERAPAFSFPAPGSRLHLQARCRSLAHTVRPRAMRRHRLDLAPWTAQRRPESEPRRHARRPGRTGRPTSSRVHPVGHSVFLHRGFESDEGDEILPFADRKPHVEGRLDERGSTAVRSAISGLRGRASPPPSFAGRAGSMLFALLDGGGVRSRRRSEPPPSPRPDTTHRSRMGAAAGNRRSVGRSTAGGDRWR